MVDGKIVIKAFMNNGKFPDMPEILHYAYVGNKRLPGIYDSKDVAMLGAIGYKYGSANSNFVTMACRMLRIDSIWTK